MKARLDAVFVPQGSQKRTPVPRSGRLPQTPAASRHAADSLRPSREVADRLAEEIRAGLKKCAESEDPIAPEVMLDKVVNGYRVVVVRKQTAPDSRVLLSPHEIEIARMIGKGLPNKTIAGVLEISSWTVGTHIRRIFAKLNVTSRAAMVTKMMELGMTENRHYAGAVAAAASAR